MKLLIGLGALSLAGPALEPQHHVGRPLRDGEYIDRTCWHTTRPYPATWVAHHPRSETYQCSPDPNLSRERIYHQGQYPLPDGDPRRGDWRPPERAQAAPPSAGNPTPFHPEVNTARYQQSLEAVVAEDARGWLLNRYVPGSLVVAETNQVSRDASVWTSVRADYQYLAQGNQRRGWVLAWFKDGEINCVGFHDARAAGCRPPGTAASRAAAEADTAESFRRAAARNRLIRECQERATSVGAYNACERTW
jgi:hypothetical protein